jgi:hypothetical protein
MLFARRTVVAVVSVIGLVWTVSSFFGSLPKHVDVEHHVHAPREEQSLRGVRESPLESPLPAAPASPFPAAPVVCEFVQSNSSGLKGKSPVEDCADCNRGKCVTRESDGTFFVDCPFAVAKRNARARVFVFFPFGGERDTLMMHLMTLKDVVDYFIIAEGSEVRNNCCFEKKKRLISFFVLLADNVGKAKAAVSDGRVQESRCNVVQAVKTNHLRSC